MGKEIATALAKEGCSIIIHYNRSQQDAIDTKKEIDKIYGDLGVDAKCMMLSANLEDPEKIKMMIQKIKDNFEYFDVLINSASTFYSTEFEDIELEEWDRVMAVNLRAPFLLSQHMKGLLDPREGCIINMADLSGVHAWKGFSHHGASKSALLHLTKSLAIALGPNIRANAIIPGQILPPGDIGEDRWKEMGQTIPLKRSGHPKNIVETIKYLITNDFITGSSIRVDGGEFLTGHGNSKANRS